MMDPDGDVGASGGGLGAKTAKANMRFLLGLLAAWVIVIIASIVFLAGLVLAVYQIGGLVGLGVFIAFLLFIMWPKKAE